jgi:outer membrane lipopolysaccharide assembly protein LptE/RlpB
MLELRQIPLCSFVSFVVNQFLRRLAVLCRSLPLAREKLPWQDRFVVTTHLEDNNMKRLLLLSIALISSVGFAQQSSRLPDNKELVSKARSYYVETDTFYMKREALESSLLGQAEFKAWNLQITGKQELADMVVRVKRVPFSNHFSYTVTDRETDTIVMAGKVDSLAGTVYGRIAKEMVEKMVALRGSPLPAQKEKQQAEAAK